MSYHLREKMLLILAEKIRKGILFGNALLLVYNNYRVIDKDELHVGVNHVFDLNTSCLSFAEPEN